MTANTKITKTNFLEVQTLFQRKAGSNINVQSFLVWQLLDRVTVGEALTRLIAIIKREGNYFKMGQEITNEVITDLVIKIHAKRGGEMANAIERKLAVDSACTENLTLAQFIKTLPLLEKMVVEEAVTC